MAHVMHLPVSLQRETFTFADLRDLSRLCRVCSTWYSLAGEAPLWQRLFHKKLGRRVSESKCAKESLERWTRMDSVLVPGQVVGEAPAGRYLHRTATVGLHSFMWGGQAFNDVWLLDTDKIVATGTAGEADTGQPVYNYNVIAENGQPLLAAPNVGVEWHYLQVDGEAPEARGGHSASVIDSSIFVFGGNTTPPHIVTFNDLWRLAYVAPEPEAGAAAGAVQAQAQATATATATATQSLARMNWQWQKVDTRGCVPEPRIGHSGEALGSRLFVFGGRNFSTQIFASTVHCFDTEDATWHELEVDGWDHRRTGHMGMSHTDGIMFFGGMDFRQEYRNDFLVLDLF